MQTWRIFAESVTNTIMDFISDSCKYDRKNCFMSMMTDKYNNPTHNNY